MVQKKKEWYTILSPKVFGANPIGETVSDMPKKVIGRIITVNAKELTGDFKKSHIEIKLLIINIEGTNAITEIKGYSVTRPYLSRFLHKGMDTLDVVHDLKTSDNHSVRIKCMATIGTKIQAEKKKLLRQRFKVELNRIMTGMTLDNLVFIASTNKIQKEIGNNLKKTYPLRFVEIKKIQLLARNTEKPAEKEIKIENLPVEEKK